MKFSKEVTNLHGGVGFYPLPRGAVVVGTVYRFDGPLPSGLLLRLSSGFYVEFASGVLHPLDQHAVQGWLREGQDG